MSARELGCRAVIVMPTTSPQVKIDAVRRLGGEVVLAGKSFTDAYNHAQTLEKKEKPTFVHHFNNPDVIAGRGTIGMEILRQHPVPIEAIFVAIGGGGLSAGVATYVKKLRPDIKIIGVQTENSDAMLRSVRAGRRIQLNDVSLFSDGTAVKMVGVETFKLVRQYVDDFVVVDTDAICTAIKDVFQETRSVLKPAGAMAVAAAKQYAAQHKLKGKTLVAVACGANMNFDRLRFVSERADIGEMREAVFCGFHAGATWQLSTVLRTGRGMQRDGIQLSNFRCAVRPCICRAASIILWGAGQNCGQFPSSWFRHTGSDAR